MLALGVTGLSGCSCESAAEDNANDRAHAEKRFIEIPPTSPTQAYAPETRAQGAQSGAPRIVTAITSDDAYTSDEPIEARRVVYRVTFKVPPGFGNAPAVLPQPPAELYIDVSDDRLRARFVGPGWPVAAGSEVRLRRDIGGTYVFDSTGGRPLGPGQLAAWFEGGRLERWLPSVRIRPPPSNEQIGPGALICTLLAEWSSQPVDELMHRCGNGGSPPSFRLGPWRAERTADVPVQLPKSGMRADQERPPAAIAREQGRVFLASATLSRIQPERAPRPADVGEHQDVRGLRIHNAGAARAVVAVQGVAVGAIDAGSTAELEGLQSGVYRIAALRPLGTLAWTPHVVTVPGEVRF